MPTYFKTKSKSSVIKPLRTNDLQSKLCVLGILVLAICTLGLSMSRVVCFFTEEFRSSIPNEASFDSKCISDEIGFMDDEQEQEALSGMTSFFNKTGVQPYVVCHGYEPNMTTKVDMEEYAKNWYKYQISNESTFLCMYFAGKTEDDAGTLVHVCGSEAALVMDDNAINTFYKNVDNYWSDGSDLGSMLSKSFAHTASDIMYSIWDNVLLLVLGLFGFVLSILLFFWYDNHYAE